MEVRWIFPVLIPERAGEIRGAIAGSLPELSGTGAAFAPFQYTQVEERTRRASSDR